ncbi:F-box only protein 21 [Leucoagaricus sp. SymC.cos]|nr:F-box only protein 21 [Leucoagaricus sp. SymC.cos]
MSGLPLDLHIAILSQLPTARCRLTKDVAIQTLVNYSQASSLLREAASVPVLWESHYQTRYQHCHPNTETLRKLRHEGNWRRMYNERYRMDKVALELLRDITLSRCIRNEKALMLSKMGLDVWDVLQIESEWSTTIRCLSNVQPPYALTLSFWARRMLEIIAREEAIDVWGTLLATADVPMEKRASSEQTMLGMSAFFGKSMHGLTRILDEMEEECRSFVENESTLNVNSSEYHVPTICERIVAYMLSKGFGPSANNAFFDMMNHFPHAYLTTNKRTLPIALVHVFVSLARRLGLDASPINFPEKVLCHVKSHREGEQPYHVNVFVADSHKCMIQMQDLGQHLSNPHLLNTIPHAYLSRYLDPADPSVMLLRAARNILVSYSHASHIPYDLAQACLYLTMVVHLMFHGDIEGIGQIMRTVDLRPIDCATFLLDKLAPLLPSPTRILLESHCKPMLEEESIEAEMVQVRRVSQSVRYCIGLPFRHRRSGYIACIVRWDTTCRASEAWINQMRVDGLDRGRHQPFYTSLVLDEHATQRYIAEENVNPIPLSEEHIDEFFEKHPNLAMYFQGVEFEDSPEPEKRWRMVLSPESRANFPEDDAIASAWVRTGIIPEAGSGGVDVSKSAVCDIA